MLFVITAFVIVNLSIYLVLSREEIIASDAVAVVSLIYFHFL
jgi:hypothetical protein